MTSCLALAVPPPFPLLDTGSGKALLSFKGGKCVGFMPLGCRKELWLMYLTAWALLPVTTGEPHPSGCPQILGVFNF